MSSGLGNRMARASGLPGGTPTPGDLVPTATHLKARSWGGMILTSFPNSDAYQGSTPMIRAQTTVSVVLSRISLHVDDIGMRLCPNCVNPMDLHQPDSGLPERMLWTCDHCATWYLMDIDAVQSDAVLVCLPDHGHFRSAISAS